MRVRNVFGLYSTTIVGLFVISTFQSLSFGESRPVEMIIDEDGPRHFSNAYGNGYAAGRALDRTAGYYEEALHKHKMVVREFGNALEAEMAKLRRTFAEQDAMFLQIRAAEKPLKEEQKRTDSLLDRAHRLMVELGYKCDAERLRLVKSQVGSGAPYLKVGDNAIAIKANGRSLADGTVSSIDPAEGTITLMVQFPIVNKRLPQRYKLAHAYPFINVSSQELERLEGAMKALVDRKEGLMSFFQGTFRMILEWWGVRDISLEERIARLSEINDTMVEPLKARNNQFERYLVSVGVQEGIQPPR
jgi:hypothetical protein